MTSFALRVAFAWLAASVTGCSGLPAQRSANVGSVEAPHARADVPGRFFFAANYPARGPEEDRLYVMPANGSARAKRITDYASVAGMIVYPARQAIGIVNLKDPAGSYLIDVRPGSDYGSTVVMRPIEMLASTDPHHLTQNVFSPDGKRIAGITSDDRMCIMDVAAQSGAPLCAEDKLPCERQIVSWSPDGARIAFSASLKSSRLRCELAEIFLMDARTGATTQLTDIAGDRMTEYQRTMYLVPGDATDHWHNSGHAAWSPDGRWIAFNLGRGIGLIRPNGTEFHVVAHGLHPAWSPDGRYIAYLVARKSRYDRRKYVTTYDMPWDLHVIRSDGTGDVSVSDDALVAEDGSALMIQQFIWSP